MLRMNCLSSDTSGLTPTQTLKILVPGDNWFSAKRSVFLPMHSLHNSATPNQASVSFRRKVTHLR